MISIIIIFLNAANFLDDAVNSVLSQSYTDWELLLVDDGSTDNSGIIAKEFEGKYPKTIKYLFHHDHLNLGMSASRNLGISHAKGEYIAFLDSDDTWPMNRLQKMLKVYQENPQLGMVLGRINYFSDDQSISTFIGLSKIKLPTNQILYPPQIFVETFSFNRGMPTTFGNILIKKDVLNSLGCFENDFKGQGDDVVVWAKVNLKFTAYILDICTLNYRRHNDASGIVDQKKGKQFDIHLRATEWVYKYVNQVDEETKEWALPIIKEALFYAMVNSYLQRSSKLPRALKTIDKFYMLFKAISNIRSKYPGSFSLYEIFTLLKRRILE